MKAKHETIRESSLYVSLPFLSDQSRSSATYIVSSTIVPDVPLKAYRAWLARPAQGGIPHKDGERARFLPDYGREGLEQEFGPRWLGSYHDACRSIKPLRA